MLHAPKGFVAAIFTVGLGGVLPKSLGKSPDKVRRKMNRIPIDSVLSASSLVFDL
jgi:hypothetical protein